MIRITREKIHTVFDKELEPVLEIESGDWNQRQIAQKKKEQGQASFGAFHQESDGKPQYHADK